MKQRFHPIHGFTLLELLITLSIITILVAIGTPALGNLLESSRSKAVRQQLQSFLGEARSFALNQSQVVTICHLDEGSKCSGDLELPLTMFVDSDRNAMLSGNERVLDTLGLDIPADTSLAWNRAGYFRFWPSGGTGALAGSITYCHSYEDKYEFRMVVARTGRVRVDYQETRCE